MYYEVVTFIEVLYGHISLLGEGDRLPSTQWRSEKVFILLIMSIISIYFYYYHVCDYSVIVIYWY